MLRSEIEEHPTRVKEFLNLKRWVSFCDGFCIRHNIQESKNRCEEIRDLSETLSAS